MRSFLPVLLFLFVSLGFVRAEDLPEYHYLAQLDAISEVPQGLCLALSIRKDDTLNRQVRLVIPPEGSFYARLHGDLARFDQEEIFYKIALRSELPRDEVAVTAIPGVITEQNLRGTVIMPTVRTDVLINPAIIAMHHITENEYLEIAPKVVKPFDK